MNRKIRLVAIAMVLVVGPLLASCQALTAKSTATPQATVSPSVGQTTGLSSSATCKNGSQSEWIEPTQVKMTSASTGWALAQCMLPARPSFAGGSTLQCE